MGSIAQLHVMGGEIGLSIVTTIFRSFVTSRLGHFLLPEQIDDLLRTTKTIESLPTDVRQAARNAFGYG